MAQVRAIIVKIVTYGLQGNENNNDEYEHA
jgi:hypothetical protein